MSRRTTILTIASFAASAAVGVKTWAERFDFLGGVEETVVGRVASPDGRRTAVVVESVAALSADAYFVRIEGEEAAMAYAATTEADTAFGSVGSTRERSNSPSTTRALRGSAPSRGSASS